MPGDWPSETLVVDLEPPMCTSWLPALRCVTVFVTQSFSRISTAKSHFLQEHVEYTGSALNKK